MSKETFETKLFLFSFLNQRLKPDQFSSSPLVVKIRRDSLSSNLSPTTIETDPNRQLLLKLKKNEHGELTTTSSAMADDNQPHITNMLSNLNDDEKWNDQQTANRYKHIEKIIIEITICFSHVLSSASETYVSRRLKIESVEN